jgi:hypothetical protein
VSIYNVRNFPGASPRTPFKGEGREGRRREHPQIKFFAYCTDNRPMPHGCLLQHIASEGDSECLLLQARLYHANHQASGGARVSTQGGIKFFLGRHMYVNFLTTFFFFYSFLLFFHQHHPPGGRRTSRTRGAIPSGKGARGGTMPPCPPGSATGADLA